MKTEEKKQGKPSRDSELRPTDDHELADRYFEIMGERFNPNRV